MMTGGRGLVVVVVLGCGCAGGVVGCGCAGVVGWLGGMNGLMSVPPINLGINGNGADLYDTTPVYYVMLIVLAVVVAGMVWLQQRPFGLALAAVRENELRAATLEGTVIASQAA